MHEHTEDLRKSPVKQIMTKDIPKVHKDMSIKDFLKLFEKHEYESFPVVDDEDNFLGDVHERDLLKLAVDPKYLSEHDIIGYMGTHLDESYFAETVEDIMKKHEVTASPETPVGDVTLEMVNEDIRSIPVVSGGKLVGMVLEKDVIQKVVEKLRKVK